MRCHKDLDVWKLSMEFVGRIYRVAKVYPKDEQYGLVSQMKRAAVSIPANISEGSARKTKKERVQFLHIALGSCAELETYLELSKMLEMVDEKTIAPLLEMRDRIARMLYGLIHALNP